MVYSAVSNANLNDNICEIINNFDVITEKPDSFLSVQPSLIAKVKSCLKSLYDLTKISEKTSSSGNALPELIIQDFDDEQIWQELELQNGDFSKQLVPQISALIAMKSRLLFPVKLNEDSEIVEEESETESLIDENLDREESGDGANLLNCPGKREEEEEYEEESESLKKDEVEESLFDSDDIKHTKKAKSKPSIVDDKFFKLSEMENFLLKAENSEGLNSKDDTVDLFGDIEFDEEDDGIKYADFFEDPEGLDGTAADQYDCDSESDMNGNGENESEMVDSENDAEVTKKIRFNLLAETEKQRNDVELKSSLDERQSRLKKRIEQMEEEMLKEKPWQMQGEVSATTRPQNSLLEEIVEFDLTVRPAPIITEETTLRLEDIIKQRIKDKAWDDVERKSKPVETPSEFKKRLVLDQEKSKLSLAQIYEQDYVRQRDAADPEVADKPEEEPKEHKEIRLMMSSLFAKLDCLANFHYTPKPAIPELRVVNNLPAITIEEVAPIATTDASLLAPEEVQRKMKGELINKSERTTTDKKRERRKKKLLQRLKKKEKEKREILINKLKPGMGNKYSKQKALEELEKVAKDRNVDKIVDMGSKNAVKSSKTFFNQLQEEVTSKIKIKSTSNKWKKETCKISAKKFKL